MRIEGHERRGCPAMAGWPGLRPGERGSCRPGCSLQGSGPGGVQRALASPGLGPLAAGGLQHTAPPGCRALGLTPRLHRL